MFSWLNSLPAILRDLPEDWLFVDDLETPSSIEESRFLTILRRMESNQAAFWSPFE